MKKEMNCHICQFEKGHSFECPLYKEPPWGSCPKCHKLFATDEEKSRGVCDNCCEEEDL